MRSFICLWLFYWLQVLIVCIQAFDDMLWVVLGWIEAMSFARLHGSLHFPWANSNFNASFPTDVHEALASLPWRGQFWIPSFQSRAKSFWLLGTQGWDTALCHGGMVWNPRLEPYKNAITNELYISASISMYQYLGNGTAVDKDPLYLQAAIEGYKWLMGSNMTNSEGLFVDGFHIDRKKPGNVECDVRDEMVYTYNQGVLLTGQRGLWDVTGSPSYLADGHNLIQAVIKATGWSLKTNQPIDLVEMSSKLPKWRGLGRGGILEEQCDASGTCSQDGQTFKGIYFHHLNAFCRSLQWNDISDPNTLNMDSFSHVKAAHESLRGECPGQWRGASSLGGNAHHAGPVSARRARPDRYEGQLRSPGVRCVLGTGRRATDQFVHLPGRRCRRLRGADRRRVGIGRRTPPAAAGIRRQLRVAVRLLHTGIPDDGEVAARA